jgi:hypothetical protein
MQLVPLLRNLSNGGHLFACRDPETVGEWRYSGLGLPRKPRLQFGFLTLFSNLKIAPKRIRICVLQ